MLFKILQTFLSRGQDSRKLVLSRDPIRIDFAVIDKSFDEFSESSVDSFQQERPTREPSLCLEQQIKHFGCADVARF